MLLAVRFTHRFNNCLLVNFFVRLMGYYRNIYSLSLHIYKLQFYADLNLLIIGYNFNHN